MKNLKKMAVLAVAALLLVGVTVGGTMAWLQATSDTVTNTFTPAGIEIELKETKNPDGTEVAAGVENWTAALIPGETYAKNPTVTLTDADTDVYLFITLANSDTAGIIEYSIDPAYWTAVPDTPGVWYREAAKTEVGTSWPILTNNQVTIADVELTMDNMPEGNQTMTFNAYAIQKSVANNAKDAWAQVSK